MSIDTWLLDKFLELEKRVDFLTERSEKMAGEYEDLMQTVADERAQFMALKQSHDDLVATLNAHIAELQDAGTNPAVGGIVISPEKFEALKAAVKGIVPDEPVVTPEPAPVEPAPEVPAEPSPEVPAELAPVEPVVSVPVDVPGEPTVTVNGDGTPVEPAPVDALLPAA